MMTNDHLAGGKYNNVTREIRRVMKKSEMKRWRVIGIRHVSSSAVGRRTKKPDGTMHVQLRGGVAVVMTRKGAGR